MRSGVMKDRYTHAREELVARIKLNGATSDERVLRAFASVPRHRFVAPQDRDDAYEDRALPLIEGQTISQPSMIALMLDALACEPDNRVLEIGGGCGYAAALLATLCSEVYSVEIRPSLVKWAKNCLSEIGCDNVFVYEADGREGLPDAAPFDRILVSAAAAEVPDALVRQLGNGGRIALPLDHNGGQVLQVGVREGTHVEWRPGVPCLFVPLVGAERL